MTCAAIACETCGAVEPRSGSDLVSWARRADGTPVCVPCAESEEVEAFAKADRYFAYLSGDGRSVTTFTGRKLGYVTYSREAQAGFCGTQTYVNVRGAGAAWHGRGPGRGMFVRLRRSKGAPDA